MVCRPGLREAHHQSLSTWPWEPPWPGTGLLSFPGSCWDRKAPGLSVCQPVGRHGGCSAPFVPNRPKGGSQGWGSTGCSGAEAEWGAKQPLGTSWGRGSPRDILCEKTVASRVGPAREADAGGVSPLVQGSIGQRWAMKATSSPPGPPRGFSWLPQADHAIAPVWREGVWPPLTALPGGGPLCWLFGGPQGLPPGASPGCSRGMETQAPASRTSGGAGIPMHTDPALVGTHSPGDGEDSNARGGPHAAAPGAWNKVTPTLWFLEPRDGPSLPLHTSRELGCLGPVGLPREGTPYGRLPGPTSGQALGSESGP